MTDRDERDGRYDWYEETVARLRHNHARLRDEVIPQVEHTFAMLRRSATVAPLAAATTLGASLVDLWDTLTHLGQKIGALIAAAPLPLRLWHAAEDWTNVRGVVSGVEGDLQVTNRQVHTYWRGWAAEAYDSVIPAHTGAANRLGLVAGSTAFALSWAALSAAMFYVLLLAVLIDLIAAALTAVAAGVSIVGAAGALATLLMILGGIVAQIGVLVLGLTEAYSRLRVWVSQMRGDLNDSSAFPNGEWPRALTTAYRNDPGTDEDWYPV